MKEPKIKEPDNSEFHCKVPHCTKPKHCRGLCKFHYHYIWRFVKRNDFTWKELEEKGKVNPRKKSGGKPGKIMQWLNS